jgi:nondiscriminating aspartyl-tRNA synthetase
VSTSLEVPIMERTLAAELTELPPGREVRLQGWLHRRRRLAEIDFLVLRDRTGLAQVVVTEPTARSQVAELVEETVIDLTGRTVANDRAPHGIEVDSPRITVLGHAEPTPVELWRPALRSRLPTVLDHAPLTWRHPRQRARWQLAAAALRGFRRHLDAAGYTEVQTPKIVGAATESGANVFALDYFGRPAYLAQSPQFYKQTLVGAFERVFEVGPVFRAEPHDTARHLASYTSLDVELGFITDHRDVLGVLRDVIAAMIDDVAAASAALQVLGLRLPAVPSELPTLHFADALRLVGAEPDEPDLAPGHEQVLGDWALREHGSDFLAVEGYPMAKRPFYTHPQPGDHRWSNSFDLLFRGVELVTGGQRLHRRADYQAALLARGEDPSAYATYLEAFKHGMPPHGGFAIGLERFIARLTGVENIREVALFPRDLHRLTP